MSQPQSPAQILKSVEREERGELERIIADLEEEQRCATPSKRKHTTLSLLGRPTVPFCPLSGSVVLVFTMRLRFEEILAGLGVRRACCSWVLLMANGGSLA